MSFITYGSPERTIIIFNFTQYSCHKEFTLERKLYFWKMYS